MGECFRDPVERVLHVLKVLTFFTALVCVLMIINMLV
jgi:hypothetical protein